MMATGSYQHAIVRIFARITCAFIFWLWALAVRRDLHVFDPRASQIELEQNRIGMEPGLIVQPNLPSIEC